MLIKRILRSDGEKTMVKIPKKARVTFEQPIPMSNGKELILKDQIVEVYLTPMGENIWTCRYQGKESPINKCFLEIVEYEEIDFHP
jgi:hypothetical protein